MSACLATCHVRRYSLQPGEPAGDEVGSAVTIFCYPVLTNSLFACLFATSQYSSIRQAPLETVAQISSCNITQHEYSTVLLDTGNQHCCYFTLAYSADSLFPFVLLADWLHEQKSANLLPCPTNCSGAKIPLDNTLNRPRITASGNSFFFDPSVDYKINTFFHKPLTSEAAPVESEECKADHIQTCGFDLRFPAVPALRRAVL